MESKQYRITRTGSGQPGNPYLVRVTWGLLDVRTVGVYNKLAQARDAAKKHAASNNVKPIILT